MLSYIKMPYAYYKALKAAKEMGLTDRGRVEMLSAGSYRPTYLHTYCNTHMRVGIDGHGNSFIYCWRCEQIVESSKGRHMTVKQQRLQKTGVVADQPETSNVIKLSVRKPPTAPTAS